MRKVCALWTALALLALPAAAQEKEQERLKNCGRVIKEILSVPDNIPQELLDKAECVIVVPSVKKFALGFGGKYGRGAITCRTGRNFTGPWSAPSMIAIEGGSFGLQIGGTATDFVLLVMNPKGVESILKSEMKLGADASVAAGPKGRTAEAATDIIMNAEILTYSRSKGLFAGVSLQGSTVREDGSANRKVYGRPLTAREIVLEGKASAPAAAQELLALLNRYSPQNKSRNAEPGR
ncbi:MAG: lipid-binding SYLF domain-containing protein [Acidobacteriia bacterium]|jgi:lipid-binding SYLF domain-containing protein|nr:lipid-binding SYLF domain-containing protein [Terriglobia bacterium]